MLGDACIFAQGFHVKTVGIIFFHNPLNPNVDGECLVISKTKEQNAICHLVAHALDKLQLGKGGFISALCDPFD